MGYVNRVVINDKIGIHPTAKDKLSGCSTIVDVGCGTGKLAHLFPQAKLIGIDSRHEAESCLRNGYTDFFLRDVENEQLHECQADGMVLSHVLEHFIKPDIALRNALSCLLPGALVYCAVPTLCNRKYYDDYTHVRPFTKAALVGLMADCGLQEVTMLHQFAVPFRGMGRVLKYLTRHDHRVEQSLADRFPRLRSNVNVHAIGIVGFPQSE